MHVLLIHNADAGRQASSRGELQALIEDAGHSVAAHAAEGRAWRHALASPGAPGAHPAGDGAGDGDGDGGGDGARDAPPPALVAVAGGDGTVAKVVLELARRGGRTPVAVLPLGGANNVARALGVVGTPAELIAGWGSAPTRAVDVGGVEAPWGRRCFLEAVGAGAFARLLAAAPRDDAPAVAARRAAGSRVDPKLARGLRRLRRLVRAARPREHRLALDGAEHGGEFLLVEMMNVPMIGPHLPLAPAADPGDGLLDVALLRPAGRAAFLDYLDARLAGEDAEPPALEVRRARTVALGWTGRRPALHVDDEPWPAPGGGHRRAGAAPPRLAARLDASVRVVVPAP